MAYLWRIYGACAENRGVSPTVAKRSDQPLCVAWVRQKSHFFGCKSAAQASVVQIRPAHSSVEPLVGGPFRGSPASRPGGLRGGAQ